MKKVLVLVAAMLLVASSAMASSVVASKHNLQLVDGGLNTEVCVYCHTPHGADTTVANAPLWNRTTSAATGYYNSTTLSTYSRPATTTARIAASDAPLCLSCHDGASIAQTLVNEPNANATDLTGFTWTSASANLGTDLSDDHPIGMNYLGVRTVKAADFQATTGLTFYDNIMWCSTCHDVHDDANYPFLATSNAASGLCLDCHIK